MQKSTSFFKIVIVAVVIIFVAAIIYFFINRDSTPCGCEMSNRPTIGNPNAQVSVVIYEDLLCPECIRFSNAIFPMIQNQYIEKGRIQFSVVPIAFTGGSEELTHRLNCLHHTDPDQFWTTLKYAMHELEFSGEYDHHQLAACDHANHHAEIKHNTEHATHLLGGDLVSPAFFVNGEYIGPYTYTSLINAIEKALAP